jgi:RNase P subunit RPR2
MTTSTNPLAKHFRQPAIYMDLPSGGKYWKENSLDLPLTKSIGVLPMTAMDEITLRTPDGLYNGQSTVNVIQSCIPAITDAWNVPNTDLDAILVAIRIASYGHNMEITSTCPSCNEISDFEYDLRNVMDSFGKPDYEKPFVLDNVSILMRPMTYKELTENNIIQFEERKIYQVNANTELTPEEKYKIMNESFIKITELSIAAIAKSVVSVTIDDNVATEYEHIAEFLKNCNSKVYSGLRTYVTALKSSTEVKPMTIECPDCGHKYESPFALDLSNFFA